MIRPHPGLRSVLPLLVLLAVVAPVQADFDSAVRAYQRQDHAAAQTELSRLAEAGEARAQTLLGYMYMAGLGVDQDLVTAHKWLNIAAAGGDRDAARTRDELTRRMSPEQIARAQAAARSWQPRRGPAPTPQPDRVLVQRIQQRLNALGYDAGVADGAAGRQTRRAIRAFQADAGLAVDGQPSAGLLAELEQEAGRTPHEAGSGPDAGWIDELRALVAEARQRQLAEPRFLQRLEALADRHGAPRPAFIFDDDFEDGDYTLNPAWQRLSGRFRVRDGLLVQAGARRGERGELILARPLPGAFALHVAFQLGGGDGETALALYADAARSAGYRLVYGDRLRLERWRGARATVLASARLPGRRHPDRVRQMEWLRTADGSMRVTLDGRTLLAVSGRPPRRDFDGFMVSSDGGPMRFERLALSHPPGSHGQRTHSRRP